MTDPIHVVHVDPEPQEGVADALANLGATVTRAATVADCLDGLAAADCVVTEYDLPDGDGVELCERVRTRRPEVPIVVFTGDGSEALAGEAIAAGAHGYVPKAEGIGTLATRVSDVLDDTVGGPTVGPEDVTTKNALDRLELLIDQSPLAIIEWDLDFAAISWNPAATELFGYTPSEAAGEPAVELLVPECDRADVREAWNALVGEGESRRSVNRNVRKDGAIITCEWFNTPLIDGDGEIVSVLSFAQDVTDEIKRADALEALQDTTHDLMRANSTDGIGRIVTDATAEVIEQPRAAFRLFDEETGALELVATTDLLIEVKDEIPPLKPGDGPLWDAYADQEAIVVDDASLDMVPYDLDITVGNAVVQPLGDHGLLSVASAEGDELGTAEIHLVHVLAATAEAALDRAEREVELARAKTIVETVGDSVYALDTTGTIVAVNDTLTSVTDYERDELIGEHVSKVLPRESLRRGYKEAQSLLEADEDVVATYEVSLETRDGEMIPCEVNTTVLRSDGECAGTVGIVRDISDRKEMESKLVDRKQKIENLHEIASLLEDCETETDIFELAVEAAEGVLNFDVCVADSVRGTYLITEAISSTLPSDDYTRKSSIDDGIAGKTYRNQQTYRIGDVTDVDDAAPESGDFRSVLSIPIGDRGVFQAVSTEPDAFDRHDEELAELLLSHVADALDRMAFEEKLREERDRFAALFENVPDAVVSARQPEGEPIVDRVNPAFERIFGYEAGEVLGESLDRFIVPADQAAEAEAINHRGTKGEIVEREVKRRTTDGLRDFMMRLVPMEMDGSSDRAFGVYTDITEQKQRQKRVEILNRVLRHDLRNGMNIINGCAEMLADAVEGDANLQYAEAIQERAGELIGLAEKTRAVERTLDRGTAATGPVDVVNGIETAIERVEAEYPDVTVTCSMPDRAFARADDLLQTAVHHVVENAVHHNDDPAPEIDLRLEADGCDEENLILTVADNGPGIPDEERELLQEEKEITQLRHASGLGLWLVNWVVTQSGGQLSFAENDPRGTIVRLEVPKADVTSTQPVSDGAAAGD